MITLDLNRLEEGINGIIGKEGEIVYVGPMHNSGIGNVITPIAFLMRGKTYIQLMDIRKVRLVGVKKEVRDEVSVVWLKENVIGHIFIGTFGIKGGEYINLGELWIGNPYINRHIPNEDEYDNSLNEIMNKGILVSNICDALKYKGDELGIESQVQDLKKMVILMRNEIDELIHKGINEYR